MLGLFNFRKVQARILFFLIFFSASLAFEGCRTYKKQIPTGSALSVENVYANVSYDHSQVSNVFLLPIENPYGNKQVFLSQNDFVTTILRNFGKFHYFHVAYDKDFPQKSGDIIHLETGRIDRLKSGAIAKKYNSQALMKISISDYQPYFPMRMKVKALLVDALTGERIWAFNEVFDSDDANVVNGMRYWWNTHMAGGYEGNRFDLNKLRPSFFMNYVFYTMGDSYGQARVDNVAVIKEQKKLELEKMKEIEKKRKRRL